MTDLRVRAVRWIEAVTAADEAFEFPFQGGELLLPGPDVVELGHEQGVDVGAWDGALAALVEDAGHIDQGEPG